MLRRIYVSHTLHNLQNPRPFVNFWVNYFWHPRWCQPWVLGLMNTSDNETRQWHLYPPTYLRQKGPPHPFPRIHPIIPWLSIQDTQWLGAFSLSSGGAGLRKIHIQRLVELGASPVWLGATSSPKIAGGSIPKVWSIHQTLHSLVGSGPVKKHNSPN